VTNQQICIGGGELLFIEASTTGAGTSTAKCAADLALSPVLLTRNAEQYSRDLRALFTRIEEVETNDIAMLLPEVRRIISSSQVAGIMTTSDFYVRQTAACCHVLGYPGLSNLAAECSHNKQLLRAKLAEHAPGLNPHYLPIPSKVDIDEVFEMANRLEFPIVVKPVDANDSLMARIAHNPADIITHVGAIRSTDLDPTGQPFSGDTLLEELVPEPEFSLEVFRMSDGSVHFVGAFEKELSGWNHAPFIKMGATFPPKLDVLDLLREAAHQVVQAIEIGVGVVDIDCRLDGNKVRVLEVNGRLVGDQMGSHLVEFATGQSLSRVAVCLAANKTVSWRAGHIKPVSIYRVPARGDGIFQGIGNAAEILDRPGVVDVIVLAPLGSRCRAAQSNQDIVASVIATGRTAQEAMDCARAGANKIEIITSSP
jgi:S-sulfo-L-cysteine synthase (3-phospho-L-serine-dependent)